jgi:hypothetical protein
MRPVCTVTKGKVRPAMMGGSAVSVNKQVRSEIENFLEALYSYPDQFARNPKITFEQYCSGLLRAANTEPRRRS